MTEPQAEENYNKTVSQEDLEFKAAERYATSNPENLPPQFKGDPAKFLDSYKELRKTLTKTQQELADIRKAKETQPNAQSLESQQVQETAPPTDTLAIPKHHRPRNNLRKRNGIGMEMNCEQQEIFQEKPEKR